MLVLHYECCIMSVALLMCRIAGFAARSEWTCCRLISLYCMLPLCSFDPVLTTCDVVTVRVMHWIELQNTDQ